MKGHGLATSMAARLPRLFAPAMQPDAVGPARPVPGMQGIGRRAEPAAVVAAAEGVREVEVVVRRGDLLVRTTLRAIIPVLKRRSVKTRMAVGQPAIFRSVGRGSFDALKIAYLCPFHGHFDLSTL